MCRLLVLVLVYLCCVLLLFVRYVVVVVVYLCVGVVVDELGCFGIGCYL